MIEGFYAEKVRDSIVQEIQEKSSKEGWKRAVVGISGGKDSSVAAALCVRALGTENVFGIMMPDCRQKDINDSLELVSRLGIPYKTINIGPVHSAVLESILQASPDEFNVEYNKESDINLSPRIRMTVLRYVGQCLGALLCGTGNLSESTVGYCTKDGDTSCDFNPLGALTSLEVVEVGLTMSELPKSLVLKTPDDGLSGIPDEEKLGVAYLQIHNYIRNNRDTGDESINERIRNMEIRNLHKRRLPHKMLCDKNGKLLVQYRNFFKS